MKALAMILGPTLADFVPTGMGFFKRGWLAIQVTRERQRLARLDDSVLRDMGISPEDAAREAARPFWDLPANR